MKGRPNWLHMHLRCTLHRISTVHSRCFDLVYTDVSGLIAVARSLADAGLMGRFRKSMLEVISSSLEFVGGSLSD